MKNSGKNELMNDQLDTHSSNSNLTLSKKENSFETDVLKYESLAPWFLFMWCLSYIMSVADASYEQFSFYWNWIHWIHKNILNSHSVRTIQFYFISIWINSNENGNSKNAIINFLYEHIAIYVCSNWILFGDFLLGMRINVHNLILWNSSFYG